MFLALNILKMLLPYPLSASVLMRAGWLAAMLFAGVALYSLSPILLRCSEWGWIKDAIKKKK